jgi:hypothetical protein
LDAPPLEQVLATTQPVKLCPLRIAVKDVQSLDPMRFHHERYAETRHQNLPDSAVLNSKGGPGILHMNAWMNIGLNPFKRVLASPTERSFGSGSTTMLRRAFPPVRNQRL